MIAKPEFISGKHIWKILILLPSAVVHLQKHIVLVVLGPRNLQIIEASHQQLPIPATVQLLNLTDGRI